MKSSTRKSERLLVDPDYDYPNHDMYNPSAIPPSERGGDEKSLTERLMEEKKIRDGTILKVWCCRELGIDGRNESYSSKIGNRFIHFNFLMREKIDI